MTTQTTNRIAWAFVALLAIAVFFQYCQNQRLRTAAVNTKIKAETAKLNANKAVIDTNAVKANNANADLRKSGNEAVNKKNELITKLPNHAKTPVPNADYDAMFEHIIQPTTVNR